MSRLPRFDFKKFQTKFIPTQLPRPSRTISIGAAWSVLAAMPLLGVAVGWLAALSDNSFKVGFAIGVGAVMVITSLLMLPFVTHTIVSSIASVLAPLFMNRYGMNERARAEKLIRFAANASTVTPTFRVVEGVLRNDLKDTPKTQADEKHDETPDEFFLRTGLGPATLYIDRESAVLIEFGEDKARAGTGKFDVLHAGKHELKKGDRYKGCVHLRPQREVVELAGVLTRDTVALNLQTAMMYHVRQNTRYLEQTQAHQTELESVRRALLPRDEWKQKTVIQLKLQINNVLRECELWQLFLVPPQPPTPAAIASLYTMGQSILPAPTRLELENRIKARVNENCWKWGVEVTRVSLDQIHPPSELCDAARRAYVIWTQLTEHLLETEKQAQAELRLAQVKQEQVRVERETQLLKAEGDKDEKVLAAQGEADAYAKLLQARADGALAFARRIEVLRQGMGTSLDDKTFRELLRALDLLRDEPKEDKEDEGDESLAKFLVRERYGRTKQ